MTQHHGVTNHLPLHGESSNVKLYQSSFDKSPPMLLKLFDVDIMFIVFGQQTHSSQMMGSVSLVITCCLYWPQIINNFLTKTQGGFHAGFLALDGIGNLGALFAAWGLRFPAISYIFATVPLCQIMLMLSQLVLYRGHEHGDAKNGGAGSVDTEEGVRNVVGGGTS